MASQKKKAYGASLTGEPFLLFECKQVARLKMTGISDKEIMDEIKTKNLFQYATEKSIQKRSRAALNRVKAIDDFMVTCLAERPSETARIVALYAIMKSNRLMYEFMTEVVRDRFTHRGHLEKHDLNEFFVTKREQNEEAAAWTDQTMQRVKNSMLQILAEAGLFTKKDNRLHNPLMDHDVVEHLVAIGDKVYLEAMGINLS